MLRDVGASAALWGPWGCGAGRGGPFKLAVGGTMAISTSALEVTPGPLRFHLGRGGGDGPLPAGGGEGGTREGRPDPIPDPSRPVPSPHAAEGPLGAATGAGGGGGSAPLPAAALKGAQRRGQVSAPRRRLLLAILPLSPPSPARPFVPRATARSPWARGSPPLGERGRSQVPLALRR